MPFTEVLSIPGFAGFNQTLKDQRQAAVFTIVGFDWPDQAKPVAFVECAGRDSQPSSNSGGVDSSFSNPEEASIVVDILRSLITGPNRMKPSDIGIITPYSGQVPHYLKSSD